MTPIEQRQWAIEQAVRTDAAAWDVVSVAQQFLDWVNQPDETPAATPAADADGWIEWNGGECPVAVGTRVMIKFRDGGSVRLPSPESLMWTHEGNSADIIAYRVVQS